MRCEVMKVGGGKSCIRLLDSETNDFDLLYDLLDLYEHSILQGRRESVCGSWRGRHGFVLRPYGYVQCPILGSPCCGRGGQ